MAISFDKVCANTVEILAQEGLGNVMQFQFGVHLNHKEPSF